MGRTLLLPPFEWYDNQAQLFANAFRATDAGRTPHFTAWSELFDIDRLRAAGADILDYIAEDDGTTFDRALLHTGGAPVPGAKKAAERATGLLQTMPCKSSRDGLQANVTWAPSQVQANASLYGRNVSFGELRCGIFNLQRDSAAVLAALSDYFGEGPTAAIFSIGHHVTSKLDDKGGDRHRPSCCLSSCCLIMRSV